MLTSYTPLDLQYQKLDCSWQKIDTSFTPIKVNWLEAKELYLSDSKLTYQDIANNYGVSLKQVKKWGARQKWREGRQEVSELTQAKITENLAESAAETNLRHSEMYQQAQELVLAQLEMLDIQMVIAVDTAEREERTVTEQELPNPSQLLQLTRDLTAAINGERVCLGLPTKVESAPIGWKPPAAQRL